MSSTPNTHPAVRRLNLPYVQVPPSPYQLSLYRTLKVTPAHVSNIASRRLKENTPLRPQHATMTQESSAPAALKRKMADRDGAPSATDSVASSAKKAKHSTVNGSTGMPLKGKQLAAPLHIVPAANACPEYPNGFIYCHQCCKKRDIIDSIRCTVLENVPATKDKPSQDKRCSNKFCRNCLKNRYGEDMDEITSKSKKKEAGHIDGAGYIFQCPRCKDICNCPRCRKAKGLEAIGSLHTGAKKPAASADEKVKNVKGRAKVSNVKDEPSVVKGKQAVLPAKKTKPLPELRWSPLYVNLTLGEAEQRMHIREFALRFAPVMDPSMTKAALEELEEISSKRKGRDDDEEMASWVSEPCIKALIMGLLGMLEEEVDRAAEKHVKFALRELKSIGMNLNKIWMVLAHMRNSIVNEATDSGSSTASTSSEFEVALSFPDPLPPPPSGTTYQTRATRSAHSSDTSVHVTHSGQFVPVISGLINSVVGSRLVREEIEQGVKEGKDAVRDAREAIKKENDRWEQVKKTMESVAKDKSHGPMNKIKREVHKMQLLNLENALKVLTPGFAPRFESLGRDKEGRWYYAVSPGVGEREAALEFLVNNLSDGKTKQGKKKARVLSEDEREEMKEWSWFIAVWGTKPDACVFPPPNANRVRKMAVDGETDDESEDEEDDGEEKWWGLSDPEEIRKAAEWISITCGLEDDDENIKPSKPRTPFKQNSASVMRILDAPNRLQLKALVRSLEDYSSLLEWRMRVDKYEVVDGVDVSPNGVHTNGKKAQGKEKSKEDRRTL